MLKLVNLPPITITLVIMNGLVFAYGMVTNSQEKMILQYGFIPNELFQDGTQLPDIILRLFTSMFMHANIAHISFNLFALAYMGGFAERSIGVPRFVALYIELIPKPSSTS